MSTVTLTDDQKRLRRSALAAIREGRVLISHAVPIAGSGTLRPHFVDGYVQSAQTCFTGTQPEFHKVEIRGENVTCSCPTAGPCAHMLAVNLVTGGGLQ